MVQIAIFKCLKVVLHPAQVEEQLFLRGSRADFDEAPTAQNEFLHRRANPPHRVGREAETAVWIEFLHTLHQSDIAFGNKLGHRQAVAAIAHGNF